MAPLRRTVTPRWSSWHGLTTGASRQIPRRSADTGGSRIQLSLGRRLPKIFPFPLLASVACVAAPLPSWHPSQIGTRRVKGLRRGAREVLGPWPVGALQPRRLRLQLVADYLTQRQGPQTASQGGSLVFTLTILFADDGDRGLRSPRIMLYLNLRACYPTSYSGGQWNHWFPVMIW